MSDEMRIVDLRTGKVRYVVTDDDVEELDSGRCEDTQLPECPEKE